jgi:hypothetical protein
VRVVMGAIELFGHVQPLGGLDEGPADLELVALMATYNAPVLGVAVVTLLCAWWVFRYFGRSGTGKGLVLSGTGTEA